MPGYFSYIAKLDSPGFSWDETPSDRFPSGNTPGPVIIPAGFSLGLGFAPEAIDHWVKKNGWEGKQLDWGAWGVIVRKADIEAIWKVEKEKRWTDQQEWLKIWDQIEMLDDDQRYVLVVAENP
jgi:hypothetical protein